MTTLPIQFNAGGPGQVPIRRRPEVAEQPSLIPLAELAKVLPAGKGKSASSERAAFWFGQMRKAVEGKETNG